MARNEASTDGTSIRQRQKHVSDKAQSSDEKDGSGSSNGDRGNSAIHKLVSICISITKYMILSVVIIAFLNYTALIKEEKVLKPEGQVVKVNDQGFYVSCIGNGKPAVVLDAPAGMNSDAWALVVHKLASITKICTFDRAGLGYSDRPFKSPDRTQGEGYSIERMTEDMNDIFVKQGLIERPFVLVGAGLAANSGQFYAEMYPDDLAALIMINPYHPHLFEMESGMWRKYWFNSFLPSLQMLHFSAIVGFTRIALHLSLIREEFKNTGVNETIIHRQKYLMCKPGHMNTVVEENFMLNTSLSQLRLLHKLRQYPAGLQTTVIRSNSVSNFAPKAINKVWEKSQEYFPKTIPVQMKTVTSKVTVDELLLKDSQLVMENVIQTVEKVRSSVTKEKKY